MMFNGLILNEDRNDPYNNQTWEILADYYGGAEYSVRKGENFFIKERGTNQFVNAFYDVKQLPISTQLRYINQQSYVNSYLSSWGGYDNPKITRQNLRYGAS